MFGYIYKTTDLKTNKIYIGKKHSGVFLGINYVGSGIIIKNIKNKCIETNIPLNERFSVELICECESLEELNDKEIYYIDYYDSRNPQIGYNIRKGGDCGPGGPMFQGHKHSKETKQKMSQSRKGKLNANYGNRWNQSDELRALHSELSRGENNGMYGKHQSDESKLKSRLHHIGKAAYSNKELDKVIMIYEEDAEQYIKDGWFKGNIHAKNFKN